MSVCLSVRPFVSKMAESGPNLLWDLTGPRGSFKDAQNYKVCLQNMLFFKTLNIHENLRTFLLLLFYNVQKVNADRFGEIYFKLLGVKYRNFYNKVNFCFNYR